MIRLADVRRLLSEATSGRRPRAEVAAEARELNGTHGPNSPHRPDVETALARHAFIAVLSSDWSIRFEQSGGPPYFVRDIDLQAWLMALDGSPGTTTIAGLRTRRPNEPAAGPLVHFFALPLTAVEATALLGIETLRGCDDLDFYEDLSFYDADGTALTIEWRPRGPRPGVATVMTDATPSARQAVAHRLLGRLGRQPSDVGWWAPEDP